MAMGFDDLIVGGQLRVGAGFVPPIKEGDEKINGSAHMEGPVVFGAPSKKEGGFDENVATLMIARTTNKDPDCVPANRSLSIKGNSEFQGDAGTPWAVNLSGNQEIKGNDQTDNALYVTGGGTNNSIYIEGDGKVTGNWTIDGTMKAGFATWSGSIVATTKLFDIQHPTLGEGNRLSHACLEGPENGVYHRGRLRRGKEIILPSYWKGLVHLTSISVQLQPIGAHQDIIVKRWDDEKIYLQSNGGLPIDCFYHVYGERKDVNSLSVEYKGDSHDDYSDEGNIYPNIITG
jgi:hypothetical protein